MSIAESKAALRAQVRATRAQRDDADRACAAGSIAEQAVALLTPASTVSAYLSMPTEPGTHALVAMLLCAGHRVLLPRIDGRRLEWIDMSPATTLNRGPMGIREPRGSAVPPAALADLDVMLLPGLAVDRAGRRLGQGGGYYDATLAAVPPHRDGGPLRAMLLFDDEVLDEVPFEPHDCVVDVAITPTAIHSFPEAP